MNQQDLASFIWAIADLLRGDYKLSEYRKVILPFTVLRRLALRGVLRGRTVFLCVDSVRGATIKLLRWTGFCSLILISAGCATRGPCEKLIGDDYLKALRQSVARQEEEAVRSETETSLSAVEIGATDWEAFEKRRRRATVRRIAVFLDGTGNTPDTETNVWRLYELAHQHAEHNPSIRPYYKNGVGTVFGNILLGSMFGIGLVDNILDAYVFIVENYQPGDEVFIFGFSRGAFTARSLNGFIEFAGLLQRDAYESSGDRRSAAEELFGFYHRENDGLPEFEARLREYIRCQAGDFPVYCGTKKVVVTAVGLFDTVPAMGVERDDYPDDHRVNLYAMEGYHAMSIDEQRDDFRLLRIDERTDLRQELREVWFAGDHSDVGGGHGEATGLEGVALHWMLEMFRKHGLFEEASNLEVDKTSSHYANGPLHDQFLEKKFFRNFGISWRRPRASDWVHASVIERLNNPQPLLIPHLRERGGRYRPQNLEKEPETHYQIETCDHFALQLEQEQSSGHNR